jgi:hypothetical protein
MHDIRPYRVVLAISFGHAAVCTVL